MKWLILLTMLFAPALWAQGMGMDESFDIVAKSFKLADSNKDGVITNEEARKLRVQYIKELRKAAANKSEARREAAMDKLYEKYDSTEYVLTPFLFAIADADGDGKVTKAELQKVEDGEEEPEITDAKRLLAVAEEEWELLLEAFTEGKKKFLDSAALKAMADMGDFRDEVESLTFYAFMALAETLADFEEQAIIEDMKRDGMEPEDDELKDLSNVKVEKADYLKLAEKWIKEELAESKPEPGKKGEKKDPAKKEPEKKEAEKKDGRRDAERKKD